MNQTTGLQAAQDRQYDVSPRYAKRRRRRKRTALLLTAALLMGFFWGRATAAEGGTHIGQPAAGYGALPVTALKTQTIAPQASSAGEAGAPVQAPAAPSGEDWRLLLVNYGTPLPDGFTVPELTTLKNGHRVDSRAYEDLQAMMDAARAAGMDPLICSSYRTWEKQAELFERKVQTLLDQGYDRIQAEDLAAEWVARPGTSEHQTGLALDIVSAGYQLLDEHQAETDTQQWLMAHCAEYGFILRYPTEKSAITGVGYEPWHYRYVGKETAKAITSWGLCLEEYLSVG